MYETRGQRLIPRRLFVRRLASHGMVATALVGASLLLGMAGYHWLEALPWIDSFLNASMILGGMGPVSELHTTAGKVFAGCYALFAGIVFLVGIGVVFLPVVHRALHRFHLEAEEAKR